jgi:hypothetical protein
MRVYHFTGATYGLDDIKKRRLKIARLADLNDLFEFVSANLSDTKKRKALMKTKTQLNETKGILCFSKNWQDPVQWGHYADRHRGVCLGFDVDDEVLMHVNYVQERGQWPEKPNRSFMKMLLGTKFAHWSYEDECRVWVQLTEEEGGLYFADFSRRMALRQVIVGAQSKITRAEVAEVLGNLVGEIEVFKARAAFRSFRIVRCKDDRLWT